MTAAAFYISPVSGRLVPYFRTSCGSFAANGWKGSSCDYVTSAFVGCSDAHSRPNIIRMGLDVYESHLRALLDTLGVRAEGESPADALRRILNFVPHEVTLYGATVIADRELKDDVIEMYRGEELLAELTGWTY